MYLRFFYIKKYLEKVKKNKEAGREMKKDAKDYAYEYKRFIF